MAWNRRYSLVSYLKSSLWVVPVLAVVAALALSRAAEQAETWLPAASLPSTVWALDKAEAAALLERIFGLNASCLIFAFGSLLVAIQVASGQYTPRIIATTLLRDRVIRWIVGLFVFSMLWANRALQLLGEGREVPRLQVYVGAMLGLASLVAFILLIDYAARQLRPVSIAIRVGREGVAVIQRVYPKPVAAFPEPPPLPARPRPGALPLDGATAAPARAIPYAGRSAVVLALNVKALVDEARRSDCTIEFAAQVGDFLGVGEPLFYVYGGGARIDERRLCRLVATGGERTMEQDPMFAFRIVVDIALKALSSAINDPTTAVIAIDQLQRLLGMVGKRTLRDHEIRDGAGKVRLILRTPDWEDYVHMSFREIMYYGAGSLQVERRLRAMVETLLATLPPHRHPALRAELDLIDAEAQKAHRFRADALLARVPDSQGLGGASGACDHEAADAHRAP